jgi:hypothetical protein
MMLKGINLTLMIGPAVPVPVPKEVLDALTSVEVTTASGTSQSGFQLNFNLSFGSLLFDLFFPGGEMVPVIRVIIMVTLNGSTEVIMDGVMQNYQVSPGTKPGQSTLTVNGHDLSTLMNIISFDGIPYPAMPPETRIMMIVAKYAALGMIPLVIPGIMTDVSIPIERIPRHKGTDLEYVKMLAKEAGYVFYVDPGPAPGMSIAYWGPEIKTGVPQPALTINMDSLSNAESIDFTFDKENKEMPVVFIQNKETKMVIPIPIPDISPLSPPLGLIPPLPPKITYLDDTSKMSPLQAVLHGMAYASQHSDCVSGTGSLDVLRYGRILKARKLVGVRGAGLAYDGLYYVKSVTHKIKRGEYKQNFTLSRNGLVSTFPNVPV